MAALELFAQMPEESRWSAGESGARIDLGTARVLRGDLAGAKDALQPVLELEPPHRTEALALRTERLGRMLGTARYRGAAEAIQLGDAIEDFAAKLHSVTELSPWLLAVLTAVLLIESFFAVRFGRRRSVESERPA